MSNAVARRTDLGHFNHIAPKIPPIVRTAIVQRRVSTRFAGTRLAARSPSIRSINLITDKEGIPQCRRVRNHARASETMGLPYHTAAKQSRTVIKIRTTDTVFVPEVLSRPPRWILGK